MTAADRLRRLRVVSVVTQVAVIALLIVYGLPWAVVAVILVLAISGYASFGTVIRRAEAQGPVVTPPSAHARRRAWLVGAASIGWALVVAGIGIAFGWLALAVAALVPAAVLWVVTLVRP